MLKFQVGLRALSSDDTRLLYCTTGILLEKLIRTKTLSKYTHIILDEVHERDIDMDFLFIIVRKLLCTVSKNVKIILMSATIEAPTFANYFKVPLNKTLVPAPIIDVDNASPFNVQEFYLCQLSRLNHVKH